MWEDHTPPPYQDTVFTGDNFQEAYLWTHKYHPNLFFEKMPKSVLQSNWYYAFQFENFDNPLHEKYVRLYDQLEAHGYDQIPTGSNHSNRVNFEKTVEYCSKIISPARLKGFMQTTWRPTLAPCFERHSEAIEQARIMIQS